MEAYFERFTISMTAEQARTGSHQGDCTGDIEFLCLQPNIRAQIARLAPATLRDELREYGAWDEEDLADHERNCERIVWLAASNIVEGAQEQG